MLDKENQFSRISLVDQTVSQLRKEIITSVYVAHSKFPSEKDLIDRFGISRLTIRSALKELAKEGLIDIIHGKTSTVKDFRKSVGAELLPQLLLHCPKETITSRVFHTFQKHIHWLYSQILIEACRYATLSDESELLGTISSIKEGMDFNSYWELEIQFCRELLRIGNNILLMMYYNSHTNLIRELVQIGLSNESGYPVTFYLEYGKKLINIICNNDMDGLFKLMPILDAASKTSINRIFRKFGVEI